MVSMAIVQASRNKSIHSRTNIVVELIRVKTKKEKRY
jgi:hypothetical protein